MGKSKPEDRWYVFVIPELPVKFGHEYPVACIVNSQTGASVDALERLQGALACWLCPSGRVGRMGPGSHLAPYELRGKLVRHNDGDFVVLTDRKP